MVLPYTGSGTDLFDGKRPDMPPTVNALQEAPQLERRTRGVQTRFSDASENIGARLFVDGLKK